MSAAATIPVLLMNPEHRSMARKRTTHRRRPTHHRRTTTHRRHNPANPRRRRYHRRNPSLDLKGLALAGLGGLGIAGAEFALDGVPSISNGWQAIILAATGVVAGGVLSMWSPAIGFGLLATGVGVGAYKGGTMLLAAPSTAASTTETKGLGMTRAELRAIRAELSAVRAQLNGPASTYDPIVEADLAYAGVR